MQPAPCLDRRFHRSAAGGYLKVGPFDLHRDGPAMGVRFLAPGRDIVGHCNHSGLDLNGISQVLRESRLRPQRLSFPVRLNQPFVPTSCDVVVPAPRLAEVLLQKGKSLPSQVRARLDAKGTHLDGRLWTHAVELRDRWGRDKSFRLVGPDRELAVWFAIVRCELGEELVAGNSGRGCESDFLVDARPDFLGSLLRSRDAFKIVGYV